MHQEQLEEDFARAARWLFGPAAAEMDTTHLRHKTHGSERLGCNASRLSRVASARLHALLRPEYALLETLEAYESSEAPPRREPRPSRLSARRDYTLGGC